jgi:hypothetical protein
MEWAKLENGRWRVMDETRWWPTKATNTKFFFFFSKKKNDSCKKEWYQKSSVVFAKFSFSTSFPFLGN